VVSLVVCAWACALVSPETEGDAIGRSDELAAEAAAPLRGKIGKIMSGVHHDNHSSATHNSAAERQSVLLRRAQHYAALAAEHRLHATRSMELVTKERGEKRISYIETSAATQLQAADTLAQRVARAEKMRANYNKAVTRVSELVHEHVQAKSKELAHKSKMGSLLGHKHEATIEWQVAKQEEDKADGVLSASKSTAEESKRHRLQLQVKAMNRQLVKTKAAGISGPGQESLEQQTQTLGEEQRTTSVNLWGDSKCATWIKQHPKNCSFKNYKKNCAKACLSMRPARAPGVVPPAHLLVGAKKLTTMDKVQQAQIKEIAAKHVEKQAADRKVQADMREHHAKLKSRSLMMQRRDSRATMEDQRKHVAELERAAVQAEEAMAASKHALQVGNEAKLAKEAAHEMSTKVPKAQATELAMKGHKAIEDKAKRADLEMTLESNSKKSTEIASANEQNRLQQVTSGRAMHSIKQASKAAEHLGYALKEMQDMKSHVSDLESVYLRAKKLSTRLAQRSAEAEEDFRNARSDSKQVVDGYEVRLATTTEPEVRSKLMSDIQKVKALVVRKQTESRKAASVSKEREQAAAKALELVDEAKKKLHRKQVSVKSQRAMFDSSKEEFSKAFTVAAMQKLEITADGADKSQDSQTAQLEPGRKSELAQKIRRQVEHEAYRMAMKHQPPTSHDLAEAKSSGDSAMMGKSRSSSDTAVENARMSAKLQSKKVSLLNLQAAAAQRISDSMEASASNDSHQKAAVRDAKESSAKAQRSAIVAASTAAKSAALAAASQQKANQAKDAMKEAQIDSNAKTNNADMHRVVETAEAAKIASDVSEAQTTKAKVDSALSEHAARKARSLGKSASSLSHQAKATSAFLVAMQDARRATRAQAMANEAKGKADSANNLSKAALASAAADRADKLSKLFDEKASKAKRHAGSLAARPAHTRSAEHVEDSPNLSAESTRLRIAEILSATEPHHRQAKRWLDQGSRLLKEAKEHAQHLLQASTRQQTEAAQSESIANEKGKYAAIIRSQYLQQLGRVQRSVDSMSTSQMQQGANEARTAAKGSRVRADVMMVTAHKAVVLAHQAQRAFQHAHEAAVSDNKPESKDARDPRHTLKAMPPGGARQLQATISDVEPVTAGVITFIDEGSTVHAAVSTQPTGDVLAHKVAAAHRLRKIARAKMRSEGLAISPELQSGGLEHMIKTQKQKLHANAEPLEIRLRNARKLRQAARTELREAGQPIPGTLKKGALATLVLRQQNRHTQPQSADDSTSTFGADEDALPPGKTKGSEKYLKHKVVAANELKEKKAGVAGKADSASDAQIRQQQDGLKSFMEKTSQEADEAHDAAESASGLDEKIAIARKLRRKARENLQKDGVPVPKSLAEGGLKDFDGGDMPKFSEPSQTGKEGSGSSDELVDQIATALRYRRNARARLQVEGIDVPQRLQKGSLEEELRKEGVSSTLITKAKMKSTLDTALDAADGESAVSDVAQPPDMSLDEAMQVGPKDLVLSIKSKSSEATQLAAELAVLHKRLHAAREKGLHMRKSISEREGKESQLKAKSKERLLKNDDAQKSLLESTTRDERVHKQALAKMAIAEQKYQLQAQLKASKRQENKIKAKEQKLPSSWQNRTTSSLLRQENKVKSDLLYRAKNGKHLQLRIASTEFMLSSQENHYLRRATDLLHAVNSKDAAKIIKSVGELMSSDDVLQRNVAKIVTSTSPLVPDATKEDLQAMSKSLTEADEALRNAAAKMRKSAKTSGVVYDSYDKAVHGHTQLYRENARVMTLLAEEGRVEHKIPISRAEVEAANWKVQQVQKEKERLRNEIIMFREQNSLKPADVRGKLVQLYSQMMDGFDSLRAQLADLSSQSGSNVGKELQERLEELMQRRLSVRKASQDLSDPRHSDDLHLGLAVYVHHGHVQECLTKEVEILTTLVTLKKTKSKSELLKSKEYLTNGQISLQRELNNLMEAKERRLRIQVKAMYKRKLQRLDRQHQKLKGEIKDLSKRYLLHLPREQIVHLLERTKKQHKATVQKLERLHAEVNKVNDNHNSTKVKYAEKILAMKAQSVVTKYSEVAQERQSLQSQVQKLQDVLHGQHSPEELRYIVSQFVTGSGADGKLVTPVKDTPASGLSYTCE